MGIARILVVTIVMLLGLILRTPAAIAQSATTGTIAGEVKDATGAVLPGVTVEASSPALIEKVRTAVTDGQGQYRIIELRPGTYAVTFSLAGFSTVRREQIELTTGFTAVLETVLRVGAVEETVTVSGASPIVDTRNVRTQNVLSHEVLDALPTGKTLSGLSSLTLGTSGAVAVTSIASRIRLSVSSEIAPCRVRSNCSIEANRSRSARCRSMWPNSSSRFTSRPLAKPSGSVRFGA